MRLVLRAMPPPAWLAPDAPDADVVASARARIARNLTGYRFPHHASPEELREVARRVAEVGESMGLEVVRSMTPAERDYWIGARLISPVFRHRAPGRVVLMDAARLLSVMVNEEDHLRIQAVTAGWSVGTAFRAAEAAEAEFARRLGFAHAPPWGFLTASPFNAGTGRRISALFHLIGLAFTGRLRGVLRALRARGLTARGLFGEASRPSGAFFQISTTDGSLEDLIGAGSYLMEEERKARREVGRDALRERTLAVVRGAVSSPALSWEDALWVLAWVRWAACAEVLEPPVLFRDVDAWVAELEIRGSRDLRTVNRHRAAFLRSKLETLVCG